MWNSFLVTISSVAVSTLVALLAAYAVSIGRFPGHRIFLSTSIALMVVPPVTLLVPMFVFMVDTGWVNHLQSVIVFYTGLLVPFAIFFLANFFRTVPGELIEAASVEGAGPFTVLRRVVMPLSGAACFTLVIVQAIWVWNELLIALVFLQTDNSRTLNAGLAQFQGRYSTNQPLVLAGALVSIAAGRAALPLRTAVLRARADGRHREVDRRERPTRLPRSRRCPSPRATGSARPAEAGDSASTPG